MFGINYSELLVIAAVALVVIGPKDLPRVMRQVGRWVGRAQGMARHFRSGIDTMIREAELEEMEKKWRDENERIMRDHPLLSPGAEMLPLTGPPATPAEPAWEVAADVPQVSEAAGPEVAGPETIRPEAAAPDADAPELPLAPPPAPKRDLP
ncbi:MAG: tatB [Alphaproteobacteria bacterium]|nr:tatB [Alphaproteobacteria bacterium]